MGASNDYKWMTKKRIESIKFVPGTFESIMEDADDASFEAYVNFDGIETIILGLADAIDCPFLLHDDEHSDFVLELNLFNIEKLIDVCSILTIRLLNAPDNEMDRKMEIARLFYNEQYEWNDELPEELCRTIRILKNVKNVLLKYYGVSLVLQMTW